MAYNILDSIPDPDIWKKIVRTCVYSRRINVARHCFAKMKCASAAAFVRWHLDEPVCHNLQKSQHIPCDLYDHCKCTSLVIHVHTVHVPV